MLLAAASTPGSVFPEAVILGAGVLGFVLSVFLYEGAQTVTMAHEGAHALSVVLMGGTLGRMKLHKGGGGETGVSGLDWFGDIVVTSIGYVGPSIFGLLGVFLLSVGDPVIVLWVTIGLLALMLLFVDDGFLKVLAFGALLYAVIRFGSADLQAFIALTWVWWLLIGAVVGAIKLVGVLFSGGNGTDAHGMRKLTWIPATLWVVVFLAGTVVALVIGGSQLLRMGSS